MPRALLTSTPGQHILDCDGDVAQLGERLNGIQEVRGSNPLISTKSCDTHILGQ